MERVSTGDVPRDSSFVPLNAIMGVRAVFLVGFMGSGKNTVGRELARRLRWHFVDLDAEVEAREHRTIPEIFRICGEPGFRSLETETLRSLVDGFLTRPTIVALGGGAFAQEINREVLRDWPSVFLQATPEDMWQRCLADGADRPLRGDRNQFARLYRERLPFYEKAGLHVETTGKPVSAICLEIERALHLSPAPDS